MTGFGISPMRDVHRQRESVVGWRYGKYLKYFHAGDPLANLSVRRSPSLRGVRRSMAARKANSHLTCCFPWCVTHCHAPNSLVNFVVSSALCFSPSRRRASRIYLPMEDPKEFGCSQYLQVLETHKHCWLYVGFLLLLFDLVPCERLIPLIADR
jgi:hypothetical protein